MQLMPAILMEGPGCRIDAASSTELICRSWGSNRSCRSDRGCGIQWKSTESYGRIFQYNCCRNACRRRWLLLFLQLLRVLCLHSRRCRCDCRPWRSIRMDLLCSRRGVLYFKGHLPMVRDADRLRTTWTLLLLYTYFKSYYLFTESIESIRTSSSVCWIYTSIYPVGCRDLHVVIKISTLEEVSSVEACYLLY